MTVVTDPTTPSEAAEATHFIPIYHLEITDEHTIRLPEELLRLFGATAGDVLAFSVTAGQGFVYKVRRPEQTQQVVYEPVPPLAGLLADYFTDHDDVMRFLEEERGPQPEPPPTGR